MLYFRGVAYMKDTSWFKRHITDIIGYHWPTGPNRFYLRFVKIKILLGKRSCNNLISYYY